MTEEEKIERVLFATKDPEVQFNGANGPSDVPAMTTMLYRVCGNSDEKFREATRLVELFIAEALKLGAKS